MPGVLSRFATFFKVYPEKFMEFGVLEDCLEYYPEQPLFYPELVLSEYTGISPTGKPGILYTVPGGTKESVL